MIEEELHVDPVDVYVTRSLLGMADLMELTKLDRPELKYESWAGVTQSRLQPVASGIRDIFSVIADGDVLVHHPYDAFSTSVEQFVSQASRDPAVLAIKQTLYRTSGEDSRSSARWCGPRSPGKQTVALVELTARFDEEANIELGASAGAGRRPRRIRRGRPEDAREDARSSSERRATRSAGTATSAPGTTTR